MIYKFRSKAAGDVIMLGPHGDHFLGVLGREPASQGIIEVARMPEALARIEAAIAADEAARSDNSDEERAPDEAVGLRQRLWPMVEMIRLSQAEDTPVVWGV